MIIALGYRIRSIIATRFRQWATERLKEYIVKGFMGLLTFKGNHPTSIEGKTAKNYLNEKELRAMGQLVSGYLDFAERQAEREQVMTMNDWAGYLDRILTMSREQLLLQFSLYLQ